MADVSPELLRLADLLRMIADTAQLIAKRSPEIDATAIHGVAAEIAALADRIECLESAAPRS